MTRDARRPKLGLRGEVLLYIGILWLLNGWFVYQSGVPDFRPPALHEIYLPPVVRATSWIITGIVAILFASQRWPLGRDRWGFGALVIMPFERSLSWLATGALGAFGVLETIGTVACLAQGLVWGVVALLIYRIGASRQTVVITAPTAEEFPVRPPTDEGDQK